MTSIRSSLYKISQRRLESKRALEKERNYRLVRRERRPQGQIVKSVLRFLFSTVGLIGLAVGIAIGGLIIYF